MSTYSIEEAKSGRAKCKRCKEKIEKGDLRIGTHSDNGEYVITSWNHVECFAIPRKFKNEYSGDTANRDFLSNEVEDKTGDEVLSNEEELEGLADVMGSKIATKKRKNAESTEGEGSETKKKTKKGKTKAKRDEDEDENVHMATIKRNAEILEEMDEEDAKLLKKKLKISPDDEKAANIYNTYKKEKLDGLKDICRWNNVHTTGKKDILLARIIDGEMRGRLAKCTACEEGRLKLCEDGQHIECTGYFDEDKGIRRACIAKFDIDEAPRLQPWYSTEPTEEEEKAMKEQYEAKADNGTDSNIPEAFLESIKNLEWDLSSKAGMKQCSTALVELLTAEDSPVAVFGGSEGVKVKEEEEDHDKSAEIKKVKMTVGKIMLANKDKNAAEILDIVIKKYGLKEANKKTKAKKAKIIASVCTVPANGKVFEVIKELADCYFNDGNRNAYNTYNKVSEAVRKLPFEITVDNAKGLGTGKKTKVDGIGKGSAEKIKEFLETGKIAKLEEKRSAQD